MISKSEIITAFKNSCVLLDIKTIMQRSISVKYQYQRNIWEINNDWLGLIRIENKINKFVIILYPLLKNGFHLKEKTGFEITKDEYEELRKLYFGNFKMDKKYFKRVNKIYSNRD